MNLYLPDYLHFRALCRRTRSLFNCSALISILEKIQTPKNDVPEMQDEDDQFKGCHYISRGHIICGGMIERAARSHHYKVLLNWLIDHGASFREVPGGIDRLCCEVYEQGDFERFRWLFSKGASLDTLAEMVFHFPGCHRPRTYEACRYHLLPLKRALREGAKPSGSHEALTAKLRLCRRRGLSDGWRKSIS
jgi:hypothetical protein